MGNIRKKHSASFKSKVALAAIREQKTTNQLTTEFSVHATQIGLWKKQALEGVSTAFSQKTKKKQVNQQVEIDELHRQIGQLIAERNWLKKKSMGTL